MLCFGPACAGNPYPLWGSGQNRRRRAKMPFPAWGHPSPFSLKKCKMLAWNSSQTHLNMSPTCQKRVRWIQAYPSHTPPQGVGWHPANGDFRVGSDPPQEPTPGGASLGTCSDRTSAEQFEPLWHLQYALLHIHVDKRIIESCWFGLVFVKLRTHC